jgi:DNA-directed RNA polymerase subunit omega
MNQPPLAKMIEITGSKYLLVVLAARRARQLTEVGTIFTGEKSVKPVTLALYEIEEGILTV